eukprot:3826296-Rhodomonas_salina.3
MLPALLLAHHTQHINTHTHTHTHTHHHHHAIPLCTGRRLGAAQEIQVRRVTDRVGVGGEQGLLDRITDAEQSSNPMFLTVLLEEVICHGTFGGALQIIMRLHIASETEQDSRMIQRRLRRRETETLADCDSPSKPAETDACMLLTVSPAAQGLRRARAAGHHARAARGALQPRRDPRPRRPLPAVGVGVARGVAGDGAAGAAEPRGGPPRVGGARAGEAAVRRALVAAALRHAAPAAAPRGALELCARLCAAGTSERLVCAACARGSITLTLQRCWGLRVWCRAFSHGVLLEA